MRTPSIILGTIASLFLAGSYISAEAQQQDTQQQAPQQQDTQQQDTQQQAPQQQAPQQQPSVDVDSDEIERFANAFESVQKVQDEARDNMMQAIEEEGLDVETYNQAFRMQEQGSESEMSEDLSAEEQEKFEQADASIDEIEQEAQTDIEQAITDANLEVERFEELWVAIQQDPELQQQVQEALQQ